MSSDADQPVLLLSTARRYFVLVTVVVASGAYNAATFTATAILPQMQGAMAATQDEISWTVTFNILATAVCTPLTGWLVGRFGRGAVQFWSLVGFSAATLMCGLSQSLEALVFWRTVQGASGAPLLPLGQTILLDVFPRRQHGFVISMFGVANTFGPVIGPTLAGYLAEYYSWRWGYYMILPVSIAATIASRFALPREEDTKAIPLDWTGFLSLSIAIAATQLMLSRGQRLDWFESNEIMLEAFIAALAFYLFIAHSVTARAPFLSPSLRQGPQLRHRRLSHRHLRHAQLHADGAAAVAAAEPAGLSGRPDRLRGELARHGRDGRLLLRHDHDAGWTCAWEW